MNDCDTKAKRASRNGIPPPSSEEAKRRMRAVRRRDTDIEVALRSAIHRLGLRFRVDRPPLSGMRSKADVVFPTERVAVYVDGCFWHACPLHATWPKANANWWRKKLEANRRRDEDTDRLLAESGWVAIRIWAHENPAEAASQVAVTVLSRRSHFVRN